MEVIALDNAEWIELNRQERNKIMKILESIDNDLKKLIKSIATEPQIEAGAKRKLEMIDKLYSRRLSVIDKKLQNLSNASELNVTLDKIKQEVKEIVEAKEATLSIRDVRGRKTGT